MSQPSRPLSPHLSIYKWQISMTLSILHRITGVGLAVGLLLVVAWLSIAAYMPDMYGSFYELISSLFGQLLLLGFTWAFYYHLGNGVRHLFWDIGKGFTLPVMARSGWTVVIFSIVMTAASWYLALNYGVKG